jgi:hypothetical protein
MRTRLQVPTHVAEVRVLPESTVQEILIRCLPVGQDNQVQGLQRAWSWSSQKVFNLFESAASSAKHGARAVCVRLASGVISRRFKRAAPFLERRLLAVPAVGLTAFLSNMVGVVGYLGAQLVFESIQNNLAHFLPQWSRGTVWDNSSAGELSTNGLAGKNSEPLCSVQKQDIHAVGVEF